MFCGLEISSMLYTVVALLVIIVISRLIGSYFLPSRKLLNPNLKTILITGCDSGIGNVLAKHFHQKGCIVIATVVSKQSPGSIKLLKELDGKRLYLVELDYTKNYSDSFKEINKIIEGSQLELHAIINNAGLLVMSRFDYLTDNQIQNQISVNISGLIMATKAVLPHLIKSKGRIINVSSTSILNSIPGTSVYTATKAAIESFSEIVRIEFQSFGVKVIVVRLGDFAKITNLMKNHKDIVKEQYESFDEKKIDHKYKHDFFLFHKYVMSKYGYFSPDKFESTSLFEDFDVAVFSKSPPRMIFIATFYFKCLIHLVKHMPAIMRESLMLYLERTSIEEEIEILKRKNQLTF